MTTTAPVTEGAPADADIGLARGARWVRAVTDWRRWTPAVVAGYLVLLSARWLFDAALSGFFHPNDLLRFASSSDLGAAWGATVDGFGARRDAFLDPLWQWVTQVVVGSDAYGHHVVMLVLHLGNGLLVRALVAAVHPVRPHLANGCALGFVLAPVNAVVLGSPGLLGVLVGASALLGCVLLAVRWARGGSPRLVVATALLGLVSAWTGGATTSALPLAAIVVCTLGWSRGDLRELRTRLAAAAGWVAVSGLALLRGGLEGAPPRDESLTRVADNLLRYGDDWASGWGLGLVDALEPTSGRLVLAVMALAVTAGLLTPALRAAALWVAWFPVALAPFLFWTSDLASQHSYVAQVGVVVALGLVLSRVTAPSEAEPGRAFRRGGVALAAVAAALFGSVGHALAGSIDAANPQTAPQERIAPWWQSLEQSVPAPEPGAQLVLLDSIGPYDIGRELGAADGGPGLRYLYGREDLRTDFPRGGRLGFGATRLDDAPLYVLRSDFRGAGRFDLVQRREGGLVTPARRTFDLLSSFTPMGSGRVVRVDDGEVAYAIVGHTSPGPKAYPRLRLTCLGGDGATREFGATGLAAGDYLLTGAWIVPPGCGGRVWVRTAQLSLAEADLVVGR